LHVGGTISDIAKAIATEWALQTKTWRSCMNYDQNTPCAECPYVGQMPGWIGDHDHPQEFVDLVKHDIPFSCHLTVTQDGGPYIHPSKEQHCAGYALFMSAKVQRSKRRELAQMQDRLKVTCNVKVLFPPDVLVNHHLLVKKV
jgi:hypothetical protein